MPEITALGGPIKTAYEGEPDTNNFTNAEKAKLANIASGAQVNTINSVASGIPGALLIPNIVQITQAGYEALSSEIQNANTFIVVG